MVVEDGLMGSEKIALESFDLACWVLGETLKSIGPLKFREDLETCERCIELEFVWETSWRNVEDLSLMLVEA